MEFNYLMSRIGTKPISIPTGVTVQVNGSEVVVKGPKGELKVLTQPGIGVRVVDREVVVERANDVKQTKAFHGLVRNLIKNNVIGVTEGYKKTLELVGTGYRVAKKGQGIALSVGYSHQVDYTAPIGVTLDIEGNNIIHVSGIDKQAVGQVAAEIRMVKPPEPYQGKGIRYQGEVVRRKAGKAAKAA